ncbi:subtilisin-like protein [Lichtheimia hyalospora FSU 10163]|nr:subtilisin-like protein [Lichtheimia hyalospora FSU 10163]
MAGALDDQFVQLLHQSDAIEFIESDNVYKTTLTRSMPIEKRSMHYKAASPNWGLSRIRQRDLNDLSTYDYADDEGHGVDVFVLDSGVRIEHPDFEGRAFSSSNFVHEEEDTDYAGHGTHVAGKVAGKVYGVAKAANIQSVKILNKTGDGKLSTMLKGLSHVVQAATPGKAVVNLSLSGPPSRVMNAAIRSLVQEHNIPVFVSAGNAGADACNFSPSSSPDVFVIGATDVTDRVASYSNTGPCVSMYAPGTDIVSTWIGGGENGNVKSLDGTSMASPHVVGIAASLLSRQSFESPKQLYSTLAELGTKNVIAFPDNSAGSENNIMAFITAEE